MTHQYAPVMTYSSPVKDLPVYPLLFETHRYAMDIAHLRATARGIRQLCRREPDPCDPCKKLWRVRDKGIEL